MQWSKINLAIKIKTEAIVISGTYHKQKPKLSYEATQSLDKRNSNTT